MLDTVIFHDGNCVALGGTNWKPESMPPGIGTQGLAKVDCVTDYIEVNLEMHRIRIVKTTNMILCAAKGILERLDIRSLCHSQCKNDIVTLVGCDAGGTEGKLEKKSTSHYCEQRKMPTLPASPTNT